MISMMVELPPRARRIHAIEADRQYYSGTTSACAENTFDTTRDNRFLRNYLRVRGEYLRGVASKPSHWELPPRARRIHLRWILGVPEVGTTSACAENTGWHLPHHPLQGNYLRVRGEYSAACTACME